MRAVRRSLTVALAVLFLGMVVFPFNQADLERLRTVMRAEALADHSAHEEHAEYDADDLGAKWQAPPVQTGQEDSGGPAQEPPPEPQAQAPVPGAAEEPPAPTQTPPEEQAQPPAPTEAPPGEELEPPTPTEAPPGEELEPPTPTEAPPGEELEPPAPTEAPPGEELEPPAPTELPPTETPPPSEEILPAEDGQAEGEGEGETDPLLENPFGEVALGGYEQPAAQAGGMLTLLLPVVYTRGDMVLHSNASADDVGGYDQSITAFVDGMTLTAAHSSDDAHPLALPPEGATASLVQDGINNGYAALADLPVRGDIGAGVYAVPILVNWTERETGERRESWVTARIAVGEETGGTTADATVPPEEESAGEVVLAEYERPAARPGDILTLTLPVDYARGDTVLHSNAKGSGEEEYDQSIAALVDDMTLTAVYSPDEDHPLALPQEGATGYLVQDGINNGYAVLADLTVRDDIGAGVYAVPILAEWTEKESGERRETLLEAGVAVEEPALDAPWEAVECLCCVHCRYCYTEEGELAAESCACVDEQGLFTYCRCGCPSLAPEGLAEGAEGAPDAEGFSKTEAPQEEEAPDDVTREDPDETPAREDPDETPAREETPQTEPVPGGEQTPAAGPEEEIAVCDCTCHQVAARSIAFPQGVIVFTFAELKDAIVDPDVSTIYLGYCDNSEPLEDGETINNGRIEYPTPAVKIEMPASKPSLTIIGTDPRNQKRVTLVDNATVEPGNAIHATANNQTFTLRDVDVIGRNIYGVLHVGGVYSGVTLNFINVEYNGVCMAYSGGTNTTVSFTNCSGVVKEVAKCLVSGANISFTGCSFTTSQAAECLLGGSSVAFTDCSIIIQDVDSRQGQEVAEACKVDLYGSNTITRNSSMNSGATFSVFWLNGAPRSLTLHSGASLVVDTSHYLIYNDGIAASALNVYGQMEVTTRGDVGCISHAESYIGDITVGSGASLLVTHLNGLYDTINTTRLTVESGGTLRIDRPVSNVRTCIHTDGAGASISFNNPASIILNNPTGNTYGVIYPWIATSFSFTAPVINLISSAFDGTGKGVWNNQDLAPFTVTGSAIGNSWTVSGTGLENNGRGSSPVSPPLPSGNFSLGAKATRFIMGSYSPLTINAVYHGDTAVTGTAPGGSSQTVLEYPYTNGVLGANPIQAIYGLGGGSYSGAFSNPIQGADSRIFVLSVQGSGIYELEAHKYRDPETVLRLDMVPETLPFETTALGATDQLIDRVDTDWSIQVMDTRTSGRPWQITASVSQQLMTEDGDTLNGALVFIDEENQMWLMLNDIPVLIAEGNVSPDLLTNIRWSRSLGPHVYLRANEGIPNVSYSTTITWQLELVP